MHHGNNFSFISAKDLVLYPSLLVHCLYLKEAHSDLWELLLQISKNGSYLFVCQAAEAFSAVVLGELPLMLHGEGNRSRVLRRTPGSLALTSGVTCNPIRASVSILGK